ncbi:MAG: hypothetical protein KF842_06710 [Caulobacter sp.]|nr:hypothetical protein [Caulobacter sp.]
MRLSEHFSLDEAIKSDTAHRLGIDNSPTPAHLLHLKHSAAGMERVRALLGGRAIIATSVYRGAALNQAVGGVSGSAHTEGWAWDFHHAVLSDLAAARLLAEKADELDFDQLIYERGRCVHISFDPRAGRGGPRRQVLSQPGGPGSRVIVGIVS